MLDVKNNWLLPLLAFIRKRPQSILGIGGVQIGGVQTLYALMSGYMMSRISLGYPSRSQSDTEIIYGFDEWISDKYQYSPGQKIWATAFFETSEEVEDTLKDYFLLFDEYLSEKGIEYPDYDEILPFYRE